MQIRKCVLLEMFSFVLIGMFSPFFHIIGSRIGTFGLFPFLDGDTISLFRPKTGPDTVTFRRRYDLTQIFGTIPDPD